MAITPVNEMLLGQAMSAQQPSRALQAAFNTGAIDADEMSALNSQLPSKQVRGFIKGGVMTPDEFTQTQRMTSNPLLNQMSDDVARAGSRTSQLALPAAGQTTTGIGGVSPRFLRAQQILNGAGMVPGGITRPVGAPAALGSGAANVADDMLIAQARATGAAGGLPANANAYANAYSSGLGAANNAGRQTFMQRLTGGLKGMGGKGALVRGAMGAGAGLLASGFVNSQDLGGEGSELDRFLTGGAMGAGLGSAAGPWGAAAGFVAGGLYNTLTGDSTNKEERISSMYTGSRDVIRDLGATYGLSQDTMDNIMLEFDISANLMKENGDEEGLKALIDNLEMNLPATIMQYRMEEEMERKQNERVMQIQQQFAPIFQSITGRSQLNSEAAMSQSLVAADALAGSNPQLAELVRMNAKNTNSSNDAMMAAYASQAALGMAGSIEEQMMVAQNTQPVNL